MLADGEDTLSWQRFLEQLYLAGLTPENGLKMLAADGSTGFKAAYENVYWMVPLQRCVFRKLLLAYCLGLSLLPEALARMPLEEVAAQFVDLFIEGTRK